MCLGETEDQFDQNGDFRRVNHYRRLGKWVRTILQRSMSVIRLCILDFVV